MLLPFWKWRKLAIGNLGQIRNLGRFQKRYIRTTFILDKWDSLKNSANISIYTNGFMVTKYKAANFIRKPLCLLWENLQIIEFNGRTGIFGKLKLKTGEHTIDIRGILAGIIYGKVLSHHSLESFGKKEEFNN